MTDREWLEAEDRADRASERWAARRDEADPRPEENPEDEVEFVCAHCGHDRLEEDATCGSDECEAWLAQDLFAAEGEDELVAAV